MSENLRGEFFDSHCILSEMDGSTTSVESQRIRTHHTDSCENRRHVGTGRYVDEYVSSLASFLHWRI